MPACQHPKHEKPRTGIVFEKQDDRLIVIFGRGTKFDAPYTVVEHPSTEAAAIDLNKTTYFYDWSVVRILVSKAKGLERNNLVIWTTFRRKTTRNDQVN